MYKCFLFVFILSAYACDYCGGYYSNDDREDNELTIEYSGSQPRGKYANVYYVNLSKNEALRTSYYSDRKTYLRLPYKEESQTMILYSSNRSDTITLSYNLELIEDDCSNGYRLLLKNIRLDSSSNPSTTLFDNNLLVGP
jgi:hypothetical protein